MQLSTLTNGQNALIEQINTTHEKQIKLLGLGVHIGSEIRILRNRSGDMVLALGNARISIGKSMSDLIQVQCA